MGMQVVENREAIRQAIDEEMQRDARVFLIGEDVALYDGPYKVSKGLLKKWGEKRIIDTPISETGFAGLSIGAAMCGLRPIVEFMKWNFSFVAADQLISNAPNIHYMTGGRFRVPIVFRGCNGAALQVGCQHSHCVENIYGNLPGYIIISPSNAYDYKGLLKSAIRSDDPVIFLESELSYGDRYEIPTEEYLVPIGVANIIKPGDDITLVSHGRVISECLEAAKALDAFGISCEIIDLRTIKPLDIATVLRSVKKTHYAVIVEEGFAFGGVAAELSFRLSEVGFDELDGPVARVTQMDVPLPYSKPLEAYSLPHAARIIAQVKQTLNR